MTPGTSVMAHSYAPLGPVHAPAGLGKQTCVPVQQSDHANVKAFIRSQRSLKKKRKKERKKESKTWINPGLTLVGGTWILVYCGWSTSGLFGGCAPALFGGTCTWGTHGNPFDSWGARRSTRSPVFLSKTNQIASHCVRIHIDRQQDPFRIFHSTMNLPKITKRPTLEPEFMYLCKISPDTFLHSQQPPYVPQRGASRRARASPAVTRRELFWSSDSLAWPSRDLNPERKDFITRSALEKSAGALVFEGVTSKPYCFWWLTSSCALF